MINIVKKQNFKNFRFMYNLDKLFANFKYFFPYFAFYFSIITKGLSLYANLFFMFGLTVSFVLKNLALSQMLQYFKLFM